MLMDSEKKVLYPEDVSKESGLGLNLVYRLLHNGKIKSVKAGDRFLISRSNYESWINGDSPKAG
jgi:excisionase family DNA binding protein